VDDSDASARFPARGSTPMVEGGKRHQRVGREVARLRRGADLRGKEAEQGEGTDGFLPKQRGEEKWGK
jgi:hypothetical protein